MSDVFISHVNHDEAIAREVARCLEEAGFSTWFYERDSVGGPSYIEQVIEAITESRAVLLIISQESVRSGQVDAEVIEAFESRKPFSPLLNGINYEEFYKLRPSWKLPLRAATALQITRENVASVFPRVIGGLKRMGIEPRLQSALGGEALPPASPSVPGDPLKVAFHFPRILVAGSPSTLDVQLRNSSPFDLEAIELRLESSGLKAPATKRVARLVPNQSVRKIVEIAPGAAGDFVLQCAISLRTEGQQKSFRGERFTGE